MTKREFLNAVIAETTNTETAKFAIAELEKLDNRNAKRSEKPSKKQIENAPIIEQIRGVLTETPITASEIAEKVEISVQKASALVKQIEGVHVIEVKIPKKGKQKGYFVEK